MSQTTTHQSKEAFLAPFQKHLNGKAIVPHIRTAAQEALAGLEFPTKRTEDWKYTNLKTLQQKSFKQASEGNISDVQPWLIPGLEADLIVFVNGQYQESLSSITYNQGIVRIVPFHQLEAADMPVFEQHFGQIVDGEKDIFSALNTAFADQGVMIHIGKGNIAPKPVMLLHINQGEGHTVGLQHRNLFVAEASSQVKIVEAFFSTGEGDSLRNNLTEISVAENANLEYIKLQLESETASQIDTTEVHQGRDSKASVFTITLSGDLIRNNLIFKLNDENTESHLMGTYLLSGRQHVDNFTQVHHKMPNCYSNELYKGILDEKSSAAFTGRINVYEDAQKTNAYQSNRNIILSETANIYTKPQLEIYADDVKCSHGATTGRIDEDAMFYLRARGINETEAKKLMIQAFTLEVTENISIEAVSEYVEGLVANRY
ncbi:MAG: Fe-S cluster assembly protein SufD [Bacteroidota bacterium]